MGTANLPLWEQFQNEPENDRLFNRLEKEFLGKRDSAQLVKLYLKRASALPAEAAAALCICAAEKHAPKTEGASKLVPRAYRKALQYGKKSPAYLREMTEDFWERGVWIPLGLLMEEQAKAETNSTDKAQMLVELAEFRAFKLNNLQGAVVSYLEAALLDDSQINIIRESLEQLYDAHKENDEVIDGLATLLETQGEYHALFKLLTEVYVQQPAVEGLPRRFELALRAGQIAGKHLSQWDTAIDCLNSAKTADPDRLNLVRKTAESLLQHSDGQENLLRFLVKIATDEEDWSHAANYLQQLAQQSTALKDRAHWQFIRGEILWDRLKAQDAALNEFEASGLLDPEMTDRVAEKFRESIKNCSDAAVRTQLESRLTELLKNAGRNEDVVTIWQSQLESTTDRISRVRLLCAIGDAHRTELRQPEKAFNYYKEAAELAESEDQHNLVFESLLNLRILGVRRSEVDSYLESQLSSLSRWDTLERLLNIRLKEAHHPDEKALTHRALGLLNCHHLNEKETGLEHLRTALTLRSNDREFITSIRQIQADQEDWAGVLQTIERERSLLESPAELVEILRERSRVIHVKRDNPGWAFIALLEATEAHPELLDDVKSALIKLENLDAIHDLFLSGSAECLPALDLHKASQTLVAMVDLETPLSWDRTDIELLRLAQKNTPLDSVTLDSLVDHLEKNGQYGPLIILLEDAAGLEQPPSFSVKCHQKAAQVSIEKLSDTERGIQHYLSALKKEPCNRLLLNEITPLLTESAQHIQLSEIYKKALEVSDLLKAEERRDLLYRQALLLDHSLGRLDEAAQAYYQLLMAEPLHPEALAFFMRYYSETEDLQGLYKVLSESLEKIEDSGDRVARNRQLGEMALEQLNDPMLACSHFSAALNEDGIQPDDNAILTQRLAEIYQSLNQNNLACETYEKGLERPVTPETRHTFLQATLSLRRHLGDVTQMFRMAELISEAETATSITFEELADLARDYSDLSREVIFLIKQLEIDPDNIQSRYRLASRLTHPMEEYDAALDVLEPLLEPGPAPLAVLQLTDRILTQQSKMEALSSLYLSQIEASSSDRYKRRLLVRLADMADFLDNTDRDWRAWALEAAVNLDPQNDVVEKSREVIPVNEMRKLPSSNEIRQRLARHFEETLNWRACAEQLHVLASQEEENESTLHVDTLRKLGHIYEHHLQDLEESGKTYRQILHTYPDDVGAHRALLRVQQDAGQYLSIIDTASRLADLDPNASDFGALLEEAAQLALSEKGDQENARALLERLVSNDPTNKSAYIRLSVLYEDSADWQPLSDTLARLSALSTLPSERIDYWKRRAEILETHLNDQETALTVYLDILQQDPSNRFAMDSLRRIHTANKSWSRVVNILARQSQQARNSNESAQYLLEAANILEFQLKNHQQAFQFYQKAHRCNPVDNRSIPGAKRVVTDASRWQEFADMLLYDAEFSNDRRNRTKRIQEAASIMAENLSSPMTALEIVLPYIEDSPGDETMFRFAVDIALSGRLSEQLEALYIRFSSVQLEPARQVSLYLELADHLNGTFSMPERAIEILFQTANSYPLQRAPLITLEKFAEDHELWSLLVEFYEQHAPLLPAPMDRSQLHLHHADILENKLNNPEKALSQLLMGHRFNPDDSQILNRAIALAEKYELTGSVFAAVESVANDSSDRGVRVNLYLKLADLAEERLGNLKTALTYLFRALSNAQEISGVMERIDRIRKAHNTDSLPHDVDNPQADEELLNAVCRLESSLLKQTRWIYEWIASESSEHPSVLLGLAQIAFKQGALKESTEHLHRSLSGLEEGDLRRERAHLLGAELLIEEGQEKEAHLLLKQLAETASPEIKSRADSILEKRYQDS